jgi:hypothetical protein
MHYKGKLKNRLYRAQIETPTPPRRGAEAYHASPEDITPAGFVVDCRQMGYNLFQVLILTNERNRSRLLKLDPQQNETWEWLN